MWSTENIQFCGKYIEKQPKTSKNSLFSAVFWSKWQDSNLRSHRPERCAIPPSLHLEMVKIFDFFVSGQTCGQTEELMIFRHSGEPKKSVFSMVFGSSRKFCAENGDWVPNAARYQLRYASIFCFLYAFSQNYHKKSRFFKRFLHRFWCFLRNFHTVFTFLFAKTLLRKRIHYSKSFLNCQTFLSG